MCLFQYGGWMISQACVLGTLTLVTRLPEISTLQTFSMADYCGTTLSLAERDLPACELKVSNKTKYSPNMDCEVMIRADYEHQLMLNFLSVDIPTCDDYLEIIDYSRNILQKPLLTPRICTSTPTDILVTYGRTAIFRFSSDSGGQGQGFKVIITVFHTGECDPTTEICCENSRCIDSGLQCGDYDSLEGNECGSGDISDGAGVIIACVFCIVFIFLVLLFLAVCREDNCRHCRYPCHLSDMCQNDKNCDCDIPRFEPGSLSTTDAQDNNTDPEPSQVIFKLEQPQSTQSSIQSINNTPLFINPVNKNKPGPVLFASTRYIVDLYQSHR